MYCVPRGDGTFHLERYPSERCFAGVHIALLLISILTVCLMTLGWPFLYTRFLRSKDEATLCDDERFRHRHPHIVLLKPERRLFFLGSYGSGIALAVAEIFTSTSAETRVAIGGTAIFVHIAAVFRLSPHVVPRDDWVLISYEFPMLMLLGIGAAAELGTVTDRTLTILSLLTLALLAGCIVFHLGDLVYHVIKDEKKGAGDDVESIESDTELDEAAISVNVEQPGGEPDEDDADKITNAPADAEITPPDEEEDVGFLASIWNMLPILSARSVLPQATTEPESIKTRDESE
jgi:hypothetical protein